MGNAFKDSLNKSSTWVTLSVCLLFSATWAEGSKKGNPPPPDPADSSAPPVSAPQTPPLTPVELPQALVSPPDPDAALASSNAPAAPASKLPEDVQKLILQLSDRIQGLELKLSLLNEKLESTQKTLLLIAKPGNDIVEVPSNGGGLALAPLPASDDPEVGYLNDDAVQLFRKSLLLYHGLKNSEAILSFSQFLEKYPDHALAGSAQFYVGKCYFKQGQFKLSLQEFERVLDSYSTSPHISDTLKSMAEVEDTLKDKAAEEKHLALLTSLFPQSPAASLTTASTATTSAPTPLTVQPTVRKPSTDPRVPNADSPLTAPLEEDTADL